MCDNEFDVGTAFGPMIQMLKDGFGSSSTSNAVLDEPRAWDQYVGDALAYFREQNKQLTDPVDFAVAMADRLLAERRKRFQTEELIDQILPEEPKAPTFCGKAIDGRWRCVQPTGHDGDCKPLTTAGAMTTPAPPPIFNNGPDTGVRVPQLPMPPTDA